MDGTSQKRPGRGPIKPLSDQQRIAKLEAAAHLIQQVADSLDLAISICGGKCGRVFVNNWAHKLAFDQLFPMPEKLRRIASRFFVPGVDQGSLDEEASS